MECRTEDLTVSGVGWSGNRLIQKVRGREEELGYISLEPTSGKYVLWLKDAFGVATTAGAYIRGEEYPSVDVARAQALDAQLVFIWHLIWMRGVVKREAEQELDDKWEEVGADVRAVPNREGLRDRLRAHLDRLPSDRIQELYKKVGTVALTQAVSEIVKRVLSGD